jgi:quercetin dioxygenase-like cupin family protein
MQVAGTRAAHVAGPGEGETTWFLQNRMTIKATADATGGAFGLVESRVAAGASPPLHVHRNEDEWYYLLDGAVTFHVGEQTYRGQPGATVFFPRGIPHTFTIESETARMLLLNAPGGFERMFESAPSTPEEAIAALAQYDVEVVGPHPRDAAVNQ